MKTAIIGGIGSGKSHITKLINSLGYTTYNCDELYREITQTQEYIDIIETNFPGTVINNSIDRKVLGNIVFSNYEKLELLNSIAKPFIMNKINSLNLVNDVFIEVPVFIGSGLENNFFDKVILVEAPMNLRIKRIKTRDNRSLDEIKKIIKAQPIDDDLRKYATDIIMNDTNDKALLDRVKDIIKNH